MVLILIKAVFFKGFFRKNFERYVNNFGVSSFNKSEKVIINLK